MSETVPSEPAREEPIKKEPIRTKGLATTIYLSLATRDKLKPLKKELGFRSYDALINHAALALQDSRKDVIEPATFDEIFLKLETRPVILTGLTGEGKSTTARHLLTQLPPDLNVFAIDSSGKDYPEFRSLDYAQALGHNWARGKGERLRYCPDTNPVVAKALVDQVLSQLFTVMYTDDLQSWVVVIDEANRYRGVALKDFIVECRKWTRKVIVITTSWKDYEEVTRVFKPEARTITA